MFETLSCTYFDLNRSSSFKMIHTWIDADQSDTKILSKFQIISKLPAVKSCACLTELLRTKFEGSILPINGAAWSAMCETRYSK